MTVFASCADAIPAPNASNSTSIIHVLLFIIPPAVFPRELACPVLGARADYTSVGRLAHRLEQIETTIGRRGCGRLYLWKAANGSPRPHSNRRISREAPRRNFKSARSSHLATSFLLRLPSDSSERCHYPRRRTPRYSTPAQSRKPSWSSGFLYTL